MIRIIIAEDHLIVRNGLKMLLGTQPDFQIVGLAADGQEVLDLLGRGIETDIVLTDINMPGMDGLTLIETLVAQKHPAKSIVLSMIDTEPYVLKVFAAGASGYALKNMDETELIFAIRIVFAGQRFLSTELTSGLIDKAVHHTFNPQPQTEKTVELSVRELEVLNLIADGMTNTEMGEQLFLSKRTIEGHRQALLDKTGSRNTARLIRYAVMNNLL
ncbi:response regulator [Pedobacter sp. GSP4]|uniref:response regulator n=1 Tax=Pedobacter sp. GSP4 TaxID=3453716 RepID=UPI003EF07D99